MAALMIMLLWQKYNMFWDLFIYFFIYVCKQQALARYSTRKYWGLGTCTFSFLQF